MSAVVALVLAGCSSDKAMTPSEIVPEPTAAQNLSEVSGLLGGNVADLVAGTTSTVTGLLKCAPLPAASASSTVGPLGGVINVGPHVLTIPPGALSKTVTITAQIVSDSASSVIFQPEGLQFSKAARPWLTLSYNNCPLVNVAALLPKRIVYTTNSLQLLSILASFDNPLTKKVYAPLEHFSRYAVAW